MPPRWLPTTTGPSTQTARTPTKASSVWGINNPASAPNMNYHLCHVNCARYARLRAHMHVKLEVTDAKNNPASIPNMNSGFVHVSCARYARLRAHMHVKLEFTDAKKTIQRRSQTCILDLFMSAARVTRGYARNCMRNVGSRPHIEDMDNG